MEIKTLSSASLGDVIDLYNHGVAHNRLSGWLDEARWQAIIAGKFFFSPDDVLVAYEGDQALGYIHLCHGPTADHSAPDPAVGSIEALFFDPERSDAGNALLDAAVRRHRETGALKVLGWSSFSGYPIYRGIFVGLEPMAMTKDQHIVDAFLQAGFTYCQHSVEMTIDYDQPVVEPVASVPIAITGGRWQIDAPWEAATWRGLEPYRNYASVDGEQVASCLYALMPAISEKYGAPVGCIGGLGTNTAWRQKGIAVCLVARAFNHMFELGARRVTLGTQHDNWAAHATYRRVGMEIEDEACAFTLDLTGAG